MKKIYLLIILILLTFICFLIILFKPRNYTIEYKVNDLLVKENYIKKEGYYIYINYKDTNYPIYINQEYNRKRKLVQNIILNELDKEICLNVTISNNSYNICSEDNTIKPLDAMSDDYKLKFNTNKKILKEIDNYKNIKIYNNDLNYFIWNYKGFYLINNKYNTLNIFKKDNYQNILTYQTEDYLLFPNYDSDYYFTKYYIYDIKKDNLKEIDFDFEISYDSYYLGHISNEIYLIDKKNQVEYLINLKRNSVDIISKDNTAKYYNGSKLEDTSLTKLINNETKFQINSIYNYSLKDDKLYLNIKDYQILVTDKKVKKIVHINKDTVYYLSNDELYSYKYLDNNKLLLKYNEWLFNYNNHIFIFN